jgi:hypothetical protein
MKMQVVKFSDLIRPDKVKCLKEMEGQSVDIVLLKSGESYLEGIVTSARGIIKGVHPFGVSDDKLVLGSVNIFYNGSPMLDGMTLPQFECDISNIDHAAFTNDLLCMSGDGKKRENGKLLCNSCLHQL